MCTDFLLPPSQSSSVRISARTMDFSNSSKVQNLTSLVKVPEGIHFKSKAPQSEGGTGHCWENQYGFIGVAMYPSTIDTSKFGPADLSYCDGLNTEGLSAAVLWLPYSEYEKPGAAKDCLEIETIVSYVLGNCSSVEDVKQQLDDLTVWFPKKWQSYLANHLCVHDSTGQNLVVEFIQGKKNYYNNTLGVLTNEPTLNIQIIDYNYTCNALTRADNALDKYVQFDKDEQGVYQISKGNGYQYEVLSSGMLGLPGDSSSPSRFKRASKLKELTPSSYNSISGVQYALQILGRVAVCEQEVLTLYGPDGKIEEPRDTYNPTLWQLVRNHSDKVLYYSTHMNHDLMGVHLNDLDFSKESSSTRILMDHDKWYTNCTNQFQKQDS